jgi:hypothetical protein
VNNDKCDSYETNLKLKEQLKSRDVQQKKYGHLWSFLASAIHVEAEVIQSAKLRIVGDSNDMMTMPDYSYVLAYNVVPLTSICWTCFFYDAELRFLVCLRLIYSAHCRAKLM